MSIVSAHRDYVLEQIFLEYLLDQQILTADELEDLLAEYEADHPNLNDPTSKAIDFSVEHGEESSSELIQTISAAVSDDVSIVSGELKNLVGKAQGHYERWTVEVQRLINKAKRIEHDIDTLLLLQEDTAGFFAHVSDAFVDLNKVDMDVTTATVDTRETTVTLNPYREYPVDASGGSRLDLSHLTQYDVTFSILSPTPTGASTPGETVPLNALKAPNTEGNSWVATVFGKQPGATTAELKIRLSTTEDKEVSRIIYDWGIQNAGGRATITCQWSIDGYQWYMVDDPSPTKALDGGTASWLFPITGMRWIKFIIIKNNFDRNEDKSFEYDFGARSIRLYGHQYDIDVGNILQTSGQEALDAEGEPVIFTTAQFDACEQINLDDDGDKITDIAYSLSASEDNITWSPWVRVSPLSRENPDYPSAILFGGVKTLDNIDFSTDDASLIRPFDTSLDVTALARSFAWEESWETETLSYLGYNLKSTEYAALNTAILLETTTGEALNPNYVANSIEVWRNIFDPDSPTTQVRGYNAGWGFEDNEYYCAFFVANSDGVVLDFGDTICIIDGVERTGETKIYRGVHTFRTDRQNWEDFGDQYSSIVNDEGLKNTDSLYPYNHKMILEGFPYADVPAGFEGERVYNGVDIIAQYYATRTSAFDLENNISLIDSLGYFAFVKGVGTDEDPAGAVILRRDLSHSDYANELCRVSWRLGEGNFRYLRMKADLTTTNTGRSPVMSSYRIKVSA